MVADALKREVQEECQIEILPTHIHRVSSHVFHDHTGRIQYHYIILNYLCELLSGDVSINSDAAAFCWKSFSEIDEMDLAEGVYETVEAWMKKEGRLP